MPLDGDNPEIAMETSVEDDELARRDRESRRSPLREIESGRHAEEHKYEGDPDRPMDRLNGQT